MTFGTAQKKVLDLTKRSPATEDLIRTFEKRIVGQPEACKVLADMVQTYQAGMREPFKPAGIALFMGMTGTGKTATVEAACEALFGSPRACVKIDCAEYQFAHELAKLVGSPSGYLGHRETPALLNQKRLNEYHNEKCKFGIVLFDELEKASDALWQLLLGILDKATLTLGDTNVVNFSQSMIICTSNLGSNDMSKLMLGRGLGYKSEAPAPVDKQKIEDIAMNAAKKQFTPEFLNRIDHTVIFNTLTEKDVEKILTMELCKLQSTLLQASSVNFYLTPGARQVILTEGYSKEYGARNLKRSIEKRISIPMAQLLSSDQAKEGDIIVISEVGKSEFEYSIEVKS